MRIKMSKPASLRSASKFPQGPSTGVSTYQDYDESAHDVEKQKDALIDEIEARMSQKVKEEQFFTVRWRII